MTILRRAAAWLCFAAAAYHYTGWMLTAFLSFCLYWALWKPDPDSPFALIAWPVWYGTGFAAIAALLHSAIYLEPWGLCAAVVLIEFYALPLHRRAYSEWAALYNQGSKQIAAGQFHDALRSAQAARAAANRIRWRGQEARAISALMDAQAQLKLGAPAAAEKAATDSIPELERTRQIQGVTLDSAYRLRGAARLLNNNPAGALSDLESAIAIRTGWAGEDITVAKDLLLAAIAQSRTNQPAVAEQSLRRALPIAQAAGDDNLIALIHASLGEASSLRAAAEYYLRHGAEGMIDHPRIAYAVIGQLSSDLRFDDAWRLWHQLWNSDADRTWMLLTRGQTLARQSLYRSARQATQRALALTTPDTEQFGWTLTLLAAIELELGNRDRARLLATQAGELLTRAGTTNAEQNRTAAREVLAACDSDTPPTGTPAELQAQDASMMLPEE